MDKVNNMEPLRHIYNDPTIDKDYLLRQLRAATRSGLLTPREYDYLKHLIERRSENA